jgi:hypothetical protein
MLTGLEDVDRSALRIWNREITDVTPELRDAYVYGTPVDQTLAGQLQASGADQLVGRPSTATRAWAMRSPAGSAWPWRARARRLCPGRWRLVPHDGDRAGHRRAGGREAGRRPRSNHGVASIGALSDQLGSQHFGTRYRYRSRGGRLDGDVLPVDLAGNAAASTSWSRPTARAWRLRKARAAQRKTVVHVETDPSVDAPSIWS